MFDLTALRARLRAWLSDATGLALPDGMLDEVCKQALDALNRAGATDYSVQGLNDAPATTLPAAAERLLEPAGERTTVLVAWGRAQYERFLAALAELRARQMQSGSQPPYSPWEEVQDV